MEEINEEKKKKITTYWKITLRLHWCNIAKHITHKKKKIIREKTYKEKRRGEGKQKGTYLWLEFEEKNSLKKILQTPLRNLNTHIGRVLHWRGKSMVAELYLREVGNSNFNKITQKYVPMSRYTNIFSDIRNLIIIILRI